MPVQSPTMVTTLRFVLLPFCSVLRRMAGFIPVTLVAACLFALPAAAQTELATSDVALEELIITLESETGRGELIEQLKALRAARRAETGKAVAPDSATLTGGSALLGAMTDRIQRIGEEFVAGAQIVGTLPRLAPWLRAQFDDPVRRAAWVDAIWKIVAVLAVAILAGLLAGWLLVRPRQALEDRANDAWVVRALILTARTMLDLVPVAVFALAAEACLSILEPQAITLSAARALVMANVLVRAILVVARMVLAPRVERLRFLPIDGESANYAYAWVRRFAYVGFYGAYTINAAAILGLPVAGGAVLLELLGLVLVGMAIALILQLRDTVRRWIAGDDAATGSALRARFADVWHVAAILYVIVLFCVWLLDVDQGFSWMARASAVTLVAIVGAQLAVFGADRLLRGLFALRPETRTRYPGLEVRAGRYLSIVHGLLRAAILFVTILIVAEAWGLQAFAWLGSATGRVVIGTVAQIVVVSVLAVVTLELTSSAIERYMSRAQERGHSSARVQTLLPLLRNVLRVTIAVLATLIVLSELGINIGPMLAGAGVAGLAIGFGAQKLVQDVINGMFLIIEDTIAIGDVVRVASHVGVCQGLTIRTITLRDLSGTVHTVPFSEVTTIENLTKDFSYAVIDVGVGYRENTDEVIEVLHQVDEDMRNDPTYAAVILEPLEVLGVDALADSAVIIKVRIKTQPIKQWMVRREFNRRMKHAFDAHNIEIPFPHTTLYFGEDKQGRAPSAHVVLAEHYDREETPSAGSAEPARETPPTGRTGGSDRTGTDLPE